MIWIIFLIMFIYFRYSIPSVIEEGSLKPCFTEIYPVVRQTAEVFLGILVNDNIVSIKSDCIFSFKFFFISLINTCLDLGNYI